MLNKKEVIYKLREFMKSSKRLLLLDVNNTDNIIDLILKILIKDIDQPISIGFLSTHQSHFTEVFSKSSSAIKTDTEYIIGTHKIKFYIFDKNFTNDSIKNIDYLIAYPIENIKEKELIKLYNNNSHLTKVIYVIQNSSEPFKNIKKLLPNIISLKESNKSSYWNFVKKTVNKNK